MTNSHAHAIRLQWMNKLSKVDAQIAHMYVHRRIWEQVHNEVHRVNPTAPPEFIWSYTQTYADSIMMTIRRLSDKDTQTDSLWAIWDSIRRNPRCVTRKAYVQGAVDLVADSHDDADIESVRMQSDAHFSESFGDGAYVDEEKIALYQKALRDGADEVTAFVDQHIAHIDRGQPRAIDLSTIHLVMDRASTSVNHMHRLLDRQSFVHELTYVEPGWKLALRNLFTASA